MLPSFTVPKFVRTPRKELRFDQVASPTSKFTACSICQMNLSGAEMVRSPRKPMYEFWTSIARRGPAVVVPHPPVFVVTAPLVDEPQMPVPDTRVETDVPTPE